MEFDLQFSQFLNRYVKCEIFLKLDFAPKEPIHLTLSDL